MQLTNIFSFIKEKYLLLILVLSIFPVYFVKISNSYLSLCFLSAVALLPLIFFNIKLLKWRPFVYLSLLFIIILLSSLWSIETKELIKKLIWIAIVFSLFCHAYKTSLLHKELVLKYITVYYYFSMLVSTAIIIFRFCPNIELNFLKIFISKICINPNILYDISRGLEIHAAVTTSNAGGFFATQNVMGAYLGIIYFIAISLYTINNEKKYLMFCAILATAIFATGSDGAILIWLILNLSTVLCLCKRKYSTNIFTLRICLPLICCGIIFSKIYHWAFGSSIIDRVAGSIYLRMKMFGFAYDNFSSHWLLGFGFGGWKKEILNYEAFSRDDALHNTLLALWANSGISAVIIGLFFIYSILKFGYKLARTQDFKLKRLGYGVILSFLCYFIQGMGENYGLIGEEHMCIILFIFLGYVYAQEKRQCL